MGQSGAVLVHGDAITMSINPPAVLISPGPVGKLDAGHGGAGQGGVRIEGERVCVSGVETSATVDAQYNSPAFPMPGKVGFSVQSNGVARSNFVSIEGKAVLWHSGDAVSVGVQLDAANPAKTPPPPPPPQVSDPGPHSGAGHIVSTRQGFVTLAT